MMRIVSLIVGGGFFDIAYTIDLPIPNLIPTLRTRGYSTVTSAGYS
jgi:hypothetical protein